MMQYLIMCPTLTWAQRTQRTLERAGLSASVVKAPQCLSARGCGYAVSIRRREKEAAALLKDSGYISGKIYVREDGGEYTEAKL